MAEQAKAAEAAKPEAEKSFVVDLTAENFDKFIKDNSAVLVDFSADWCYWCKVLHPEYESAANTLHADPTLKDVKLVRIDGNDDANRDLLQKYEVRGFPTLKFFKDNNVEEPMPYSGERNAVGIVKWIGARLGAPVTVLATKEDFTKFSAQDGIVMIANLEGDKDSNPEIDNLDKFAGKHLDDVKIGLVSNADLAKECGLDGVVVRLFRKFDEPTVDYKGDNLGELDNFFNSEKFPLIGTIGPENFKLYMTRKNGDTPVPMAWVALDKMDDEKAMQEYTEALQPIAAKLKGDISIVFIDNSKYSGQVKNLGLKDIPSMLIKEEKAKYVYGGDLKDGTALATYFDDYKSGKLEKYVKSLAVPDNEVTDGLYHLVATTLENYVGSDNCEVMCDFFAEWCGPCKSMAPAYAEAAKQVKESGIDGLIVAKIDADLNDCFYEIEGYPTIVFFKKGSKEGTEFDGPRTTNGFLAFIKKHSELDTSKLVVTEEEPKDKSEEKPESK